MSISSARLQEWLHRYGPAEVVSLAATLGAASWAAHRGDSGIAIALAATWAGNIAYFGLILGQDVWRTHRQLRQQGHYYGWRALGRNAAALAVEFGVAEVLDSFLIRPTLMYWVPRWLHSVPAGVLVAKLAADSTFYVPAIVGYELSKRRLRD